MALCKLFEYGVATQDNRLTAITYNEQMDIPTGDRIRTRSAAATCQKFVEIPALVKIFKVLISEYQHFQEVITEDPLTDSEEEVTENDDAPGSASKPRFISDLCFDGDDENEEDEQVLQALLKESNYTSDIRENLQTFFTNFAQNEHFPTFYEHLNEAERHVLLSKVQPK